MVENWEIEWNDSMLQHGQDMGTVEFLVAKGGNLSDINYVLYGVQDDSWEPIIKAVATRDYSHPDIIRKQLAQGFENQELAQEGMGRNIAQNLQAIGAGKRLAEAQAANQPGRALDYARTGQYGSALAAGARNLFGGGQRQTGQPGMFRRIGQTMRELPRAFREGQRARSDARDAQARRSRLEGGLAQASGETRSARSRYVPGSQGFDENMQQQQGALNRRLARDFNINIPTDASGQPTTTAQDAMREEIARIGEGATQKRPGVLDRARRMAAERRGQEQGDAFRPDRVAGAEQPMEDMPAGSPEAERRAMSDEAGTPLMELDFTDTEQPATEAPPMTQAGPPAPAAPEESALTDKQKQAMEMFDRVQANKRARMAMEGGEETATATEAAGDDALRGRVSDFLTNPTGREKGQFYGAKTIGEKGSQKDLVSNIMATGFDPADTAMKITQEMIDAMGFSARSPQGRYFKQQLQADPRFQQAVAAGDEPKAKQVAEEKAKPLMQLDFGDTEVPDEDDPMSEGGAFEMSEDKHQVAWDSLLKGFKIR